MPGVRLVEDYEDNETAMDDVRSAAGASTQSSNPFSSHAYIRYNDHTAGRTPSASAQYDMDEEDIAWLAKVTNKNVSNTPGR